MQKSSYKPDHMENRQSKMHKKGTPGNSRRIWQRFMRIYFGRGGKLFQSPSLQERKVRFEQPLRRDKKPIRIDRKLAW